MKPTTKEQVKVTLLVDLEYETQEDRASLILAIRAQTSELNYGYRGCSMGAVSNSVTVSRNDESVIRAYQVNYGLLPPVIIRTISPSRAKEVMHQKVLEIPDYLGPISDESAIIVTEAPQFTWNSQLLPGNVYSLEHAEAVNKK